MTDTTERQAQNAARHAIGNILDGLSPNGADPAHLGGYAECYQEMVRAHAAGGTEAARRVFVAYAERDPAFAALRAADPDTKQVWTTADLLTAVFPPPKWSIPGLVPVGLNILAGRPKLGKSWLGLQFAVAVGSGGVALGHIVERGKVLYLALEDNPRRVQDRLRKQQAQPGAAIDFRFEWQPLTGTGTADLLAAIDGHGYTLIVIDTISRALGRADQMDQADMNVTLGALQRVAIEREVAILMVDHHRKSGASGAGDVIDDVMGATSKAGVADNALGLYRKRGEKTATLKVSGRDVDDQEMALGWDAQLFCWQLAGDAAGVKSESVQADIIVALNEMGGAATVTRVANWLNRDKGNIYREMQELVVKGEIRRGATKQGREVVYTATGKD